MNTLYIFLDESGNLDFSDSGTNNFVLAAVAALTPMKSSQELQQLKYQFLADGIDIQHFHASEDKQIVRDKVFSTIDNLRSVSVHYIYANKHKTHPDYQNTAQFYGLLGKTLLKYIFNSDSAGKFDQIVIIFDKNLTNKEQGVFHKMVKPELKGLGKPFHVYFHQTLSDFNGQIADYLAWAKFVSLERNEKRPLEAINSIRSSSFDIFRTGKKKLLLKTMTHPTIPCGKSPR